MTEWVSVGTDEKGVHGLIRCFQPTPDSDWESTLTVYKADRAILFAEEDDGPHGLFVGDFRLSVENGTWDEDGCPNFDNLSVELSPTDLRLIAQMIEDFHNNVDLSRCPRWKEV